MVKPGSLSAQLQLSLYEINNAIQSSTIINYICVNWSLVLSNMILVPNFVKPLSRIGKETSHKECITIDPVQRDVCVAKSKKRGNTF